MKEVDLSSKHKLETLFIYIYYHDKSLSSVKTAPHKVHKMSM